MHPPPLLSSPLPSTPTTRPISLQDGSVQGDHHRLRLALDPASFSLRWGPSLLAGSVFLGFLRATRRGRDPPPYEHEHEHGPSDRGTTSGPSARRDRAVPARLGRGSSEEEIDPGRCGLHLRKVVGKHKIMQHIPQNKEPMQEYVKEPWLKITQHLLKPSICKNPRSSVSPTYLWLISLWM